MAVSRPAPLAVAARFFLTGGVFLGAVSTGARAELPVPADVLVAAGAGKVLPPQIDGNVMTIRQLSDKATLDWKSFNVGAENAVVFKQPSSDSVALNNIHQGDPSRIYGSLTANGQVYLINQNGFVFGKDSQINVNSLVASTLNIGEKTFRLGIVQAFDQGRQAAFSATDAQGNAIKSLYLKDANGQPVLDQNGQKVKIQIFVEEGAKLKTDAPGGRIILAAPSIDNRGDIEAPDGQVILAASQDKVYLQQADAGADLRGLLVEVGTGGDVNNVGKILAERGNVSLIGFAVNQKGIASATTSVKLNGSVRLLAREGVQDAVASGGALRPSSTKRAGDIGDGLGTRARVVLGEDSLTSVELDEDKNETAVDAQTQSRSRIEIAGHTVHAKNGATVKALAGAIGIDAVDNPATPTVKGDARIYLDDGAAIDASGAKNVVLPMSRNIVQAELRGSELRDSPLQRDGLLHGETVAVDIRDVDADGRIPIADLSGALARIERNIDERSVAGGDIRLSSSGDVVARPGAKLDVSGGQVTYAGGTIQTTQLVADDGEIFDISRADPDRRYVSLIGAVGKNPGVAKPGPARYEESYVEGQPAGEIDIEAFNAMLDGMIDASAARGRAQQAAGEQALGGTLSIDLNRALLTGRQDVAFDDRKALALSADAPFPTDAENGQPVALALDPTLLKASGVREFVLKTNGALVVPEGRRLSAPAGGKIELAAGGFDVQGAIEAPGGTIDLSPATYLLDGKPEFLPSAIVVGEKAELSARGAWTNAFLEKNGPTIAPAAIDGGVVRLTTEQGDLVVRNGALIDVSGGAWLSPDAKVSTGRGGTIQLTAATRVVGAPPSSLSLDGRLAGWGAERGGVLSLNADALYIGAGAPQPGANGRLPLTLSPDFFRQGGFADYRLASNSKSVVVADGTVIELKQDNLALPADLATLPSGADLTALSGRVLRPDGARQPVNLDISLKQATGQDRTQFVGVGSGARILADPQATVSLRSDTSILIDGEIRAPAGAIKLEIALPGAGDSGFFAGQGIWLGDGARLAAPGAFVPDFAATGLRSGAVLPGGTIEAKAARGYIVAARNASLDASGVAAELDFIDPAGADATPTARIVPSAGGRIRLQAGEGILGDATLRAKSGGAGAEGGTLSVELNGLARAKPGEPIPGGEFPDDANPETPRVIEISADAKPFAPQNLSLGSPVPGQFNGRALLSAANLGDGGFGTLQFKTDAVNGVAYVGQIRFDGDVRLDAGRQITLDAPVFSWRQPSEAGHVELHAPYIVLGSTQSRIDVKRSGGKFDSVLAPAASGGAGTFSADGQGVDLTGGLSFRGFGQVALRSAGDLRAIGVRIASDTKNYLGELNVDGDLTLQAAQAYPVTLTDYRIALKGEERTLTVLNAGAAPGPALSAGGSLSLSAAHIVQSGVLRAPFGALSLNADKTLTLTPGSLTSVAGGDAKILFGRGSGNLNWLYPLDAGGVNNRVVDVPPAKRIALTAPDIDLAAGARIDVSGGGDLYAYEFIVGPGGSTDVLDASDPSFVAKFAVMPGVHGISTPYDPAEFPASGLRVGDSVYLSADASGLPAGRYTLLPAHYALLPGAYLVTPLSAAGDMSPGQTYPLFDGATVVAGRYGVAGTDIQDARWRGFAVASGQVARTRSQYQDYSANAFFEAKAAAGVAAPQLPKDAGALTFAARTRMNFEAQIFASSQDGLGGEVDIAAERLAIVARREDLGQSGDGTVTLAADELNRLNVRSLLLGGTREATATGQRLTVAADRVEVRDGAALSGREIVLAARDRVSVEAGASLRGEGEKDANTPALSVANRASGDGALLRVSALGQGQVVREGATPGATGVLSVAAGARLAASGSMLLDSTQDTNFAGMIEMQGGSLALNARRIGIGAAPAGVSGLVLPNLNFSLDELKLRSASELNLYGGVTVAAGNLDIQAARVNGFANAGQTASVTAEVIRLGNDRAQAQLFGDGQGTLRLSARNIELGGGGYGIFGFDAVTLEASEALRGKGDTAGVLTVAGDVAVLAGRILGANGADSVLDATGHALTFALPQTPVASTAPAGLGASWRFAADAIAGAGRFDLPSGALRLSAGQGDLRLSSGASIDVSGRASRFSGLTRYTPAGSVALEARQGDVLLDAGAALKLSGADGDGAGSEAGVLTIAAPNGEFRWLGDIRAQADAGARQGRFDLDALHFGPNGLAGLSGQLAESGFSESIVLRQRDGDLELPAGAALRAHNLALTADAGAATILGTLDASGTRGGRIAVHGGLGIVLGAAARIDAHAEGVGEAGGTAFLDAINPAHGTVSGLLDGSAGGVVDVSGGVGGTGGQVSLRAGRDDAGGRVFASVGGVDIVGASRATLEATRVYENQTVVDAAAIERYRADTAAFMARGPNAGNAALTLAPGLELRAAGDLVVASPWDFMASDPATGASAWRYKGVPGYLTLSAGGDLRIEATITDAFANAHLPDPVYGALKDVIFQDVLQPGESWSYRLQAKGDVLLSPSYQGVDPTDPFSQVDRQVMVRTGTGSIEAQAGGDIRFLADRANPKAAAALYTMGRPADYTFTDLLLGAVPGVEAPRADENLADYLRRQDPDALAASLRWGYYNVYNAGFGFLAEYPQNGGDIALRAGGDIGGVQTGQLTSDWLVRSGSWNDNPQDNGKLPTAWGVNVSGSSADQLSVALDAAGNSTFYNVKGLRFFNQNVGALGGGDVSVRAGGDVRDLSVMIPTTGKPTGVLTTPFNDGKPDLEVAADTRWVENGVAVSGGGNLNVSAGGDIVGGEYYTGRGEGRLDAGGSIAASSAKLGATVALGDAAFELTARKDIALGAAFNPTLLPQRQIPDAATLKNSFFFTYSPQSALSLLSVAGDIALQNNVETLKALKGYLAQDGAGFELAVYPGSISATAQVGDIRIDGSFNLYPSPSGKFELLAGNAIGSGARANSIVKVNMSDADPALLPDLRLPALSLAGDLTRKDIKTRERFDPESPLANAVHAALPVHGAGGARAEIVARDGDIAFPAGVTMKFFLPQAAEVRAGRDIRNFSLYAQNLNPLDITHVQAGRDILFDSRLDANGGVIPLDQRIEVSGPGRLQILAGRNVNLGSSSGVITIGNLFNTALPDFGGAAIDVLAGLSDRLDVKGFLDRHLTVDSAYLAALSLSGADGTDALAGLTPEQKLEYVAGLDEEARLGVAQSLFFGEIRAAAAAAAAAPEERREDLYRRGFDAIAALFPGKNYAGNLAMVFSQIKSLDGGDVNLSTPGGRVDVGLAGKVGGIQKSASQLGAVVQQRGDLNAFAQGDFNVNQSRVFTLGGGDISIWSSTGDIDAGKGAKSAISAPPPITRVDEKGNIVTIFPPIVSGSGIQAISPADESARQGNVYLAAPAGVVNAGDAGIGGGRIVIAANAVIGASNIQASGGTVGVPAAVVAPSIPVGADGAAAGAAKSATQSAGQEGEGGTKDGERRNAAVSILTADVIGFGECGIDDIRQGKPGCGGEAPPQERPDAANDNKNL